MLSSFRIPHSPSSRLLLRCKFSLLSSVALSCVVAAVRWNRWSLVSKFLHSIQSPTPSAVERSVGVLAIQFALYKSRKGIRRRKVNSVHWNWTGPAFFCPFRVFHALILFARIYNYFSSIVALTNGVRPDPTASQQDLIYGTCSLLELSRKLVKVFFFASE